MIINFKSWQGFVPAGNNPKNYTLRVLSKHLYCPLLQELSPIIFSRVVLDVCKNRMGSQLDELPHY